MTSAHSPLVVRNLNKHFGSVRALRDVSLTLQPGTITGLLGPNGAGKTTLIRICAGLLRQDSGEVFVHGLSQSPWNLATRALIGVVSADAPPAGELTVLETLRVRAVLCGLYGSALREACTSAVRHYGLEGVLTRRVFALSTGMRQRVAIACAMLHAPRLLLLDEPTVGLDPDARTHLWDCLRDLANAGVTLLLTTHYLDEVTRLCDCAYLLIRGALTMTMSSSAMLTSTDALEHAYLEAIRGER